MQFTQINLKMLKVSYVGGIDYDDIQEISSALDQLERYTIGEFLCLPTVPKPNAQFAIGHGDDCILLKYYVEEHTICITHNTDNSPVHLDSCVEFFISFNEDDSYYNIEFNCIGVCCMEFGKSRSDRLLIPEQKIAKITRKSNINTNVENGRGFIRWELCLKIPTGVFIFHEAISLSEVKCKANFYKCGDHLPTPHFLSWQKIISEKPNFHLPQFFQDIHFLQPALIETTNQ